MSSSIGKSSTHTKAPAAATVGGGGSTGSPASHLIADVVGYLR